MGFIIGLHKVTKFTHADACGKPATRRLRYKQGSYGRNEEQDIVASNEGNDMTGWVRYVRAGALGLALGGAVTGPIVHTSPAFAQDNRERPSPPKGLHWYTPPKPAQPPTSEAANRSAVPTEFDQQRRRDGRMTPEERRLLRQHIEDAVRELYKR